MDERARIGFGDAEPVVVQASAAEVVRALSTSADRFVQFTNQNGQEVHLAVAQVKYVVDITIRDRPRY